MDLKEFQELSSDVIGKMDKKSKGKHDVDTTIVHLMEEIGEIAREIFTEKIGRGKLNLENLRKEFADTFMLLAHLANHFDIDVENSFKEKIAELKKRFEDD